MATAQDLLNWYRSQIGYKEGKNNSNKFSTAMGRPAESWCADFIDAGFKACNALNLITSSPSCTAKYKGMKNLEVSKNSLRPGDIVFFDWDKSGDCDHVGIVESAGSSQVTTIEGNTSSGNSGSQSNGDGVYRRYRTYSQIAHAVRPKYDGASSSSSGTITNGNSYIKYGQQKANEFVKKYAPASKVVSIATDGIWGPNTRKQAIRVLQLAMNKDYGSGLVIDGEFGTKSNKALGSHYVAKGEKQYMVSAAEILLYLNGKNPNGFETPGIFGSGLEKAAGKSKITASDFKAYLK